MLRTESPVEPIGSGWTPIRVQWDGQRPMLDWCRTGSTRFTDPFFDQTVERCLRRPFNLLFRRLTPVQSALDLRPTRVPSGFVFHLSRCGSTLVSQMLAAVPSNVVVSEAGPVESIVRARERVPALPDDVHLAWLRAVVGALGRPLADQVNGAYVIKMDTWSTVHLDLVRRAFPEVPWVFCYRDPVEVMVSQLEQRAAVFMPGTLPPAALGLDEPSLADLSAEELCARVLARIAGAALEHARDPLGRLVNYDELPGAVPGVIVPWFGISPQPGELELMEQASLRDAKSPGSSFRPDGARKRRHASPAVLEQAERWLRPLHDRLERARLEHPPLRGTRLDQQLRQPVGPTVGSTVPPGDASATPRVCS